MSDHWEPSGADERAYPPTEAYPSQQPDAYPPPPPPPAAGPPPTQRNRLPWIIGGAVVVVLLVVAAIAAGMSGDDNTDTADRPDATVTPPGEQPVDEDTPTTTADEGDAANGIPDAASAYFDALASEDLSKMGAMIDNSVEGSPAGLYAVHQVANVRAIGTSLGTTMRTAGDTIVLTSTTGYDNSGSEQTQSTTYSAFTLEDDKLTGFRVDDTPVADRIRAGGEPVANNGVTVRIVTAYVTARGDLALNVDTTNGRQGVLELAGYEWTLTTPDGRQLDASQNFCCPTDPSIQPGATAGYVVLFEQVGLGGTLRFVGYSDDFVTEHRFDVAVPA